MVKDFVDVTVAIYGQRLLAGSSRSVTACLGLKCISMCMDLLFDRCLC